MAVSRLARLRAVRLRRIGVMVALSVIAPVGLVDSAWAGTASSPPTASTTTKKSTVKTTTKSTKKKKKKKKSTKKSVTAAKPVVSATVSFPALGDIPKGLESIGSFRVVCYSGGTKTASGQPVSTDAVAVDPTVIPLHTRLYIDSVGWRTALDTGVKGNTLDIWMPSVDDCRTWGARQRIAYAVSMTPAGESVPSAPAAESPPSVQATEPVAEVQPVPVENIATEAMP